MLIDGRYEVICSLGGGDVYKVKDTLDNSVLALKWCKSEEPGTVMEFKNEFFTLANLTHPNIVRVYDFKRTDIGYYFTMEFVEGDNIFDHFTKRREDYEFFSLVVGELLQVLYHVHQKGLIHGDIKPQNIMIQKKKAKLLDFGLARVVGASSELAGGTLAYIAPELFKGGRIDPRVDLYSLGVVFYETLRRKKIQSLNEKLTHLKEPVPKRLRNIVTKLTKRDPDQRYGSVKEVWEDLHEHPPEMKSQFRPSVLTSRTVGRDFKMSELRKLYADSKEKGKIVLVVGERGIGKSRMLREFGYECQMEDCSVIHLVCPKREQLPLSLVRRILQDGGKKLEKGSRISPRLPKESAQLKLFEELTKVFKEFSNVDGPLLLLVDELDCADPLSIEFLAYFAPELANTAIFFVGVVEDETKLTPIIETTREMDILSRIELKRLSLKNTRAMISSMLSSEKVDGIAEWIHEKTGGNPLHIEKTLEYLIRKECAHRSGDAWVLDRPRVKELKPAPSLRSMIEISLKSCEREELRLLQCASAIGNFFDISLLQELSEYNNNCFYPILLRLRYSDLVRGIKGTQYGFSHGWMREILHEKLSASRRKSLHSKIFRILRKIGAPSETLFYHASNCGRDRDACEHALHAGENAEKSFDHRTALQYYDAALGLRHKLKLKEDAFLYEKMGDLQHLTGSYEGALRNYNRALKFSRMSHKLDLKIGKVYRDRGDYQEAIVCFTRIPASRPPTCLEALNQTAWAYLQMNELKKALQFTLRAKGIAEKRHSHKSLADSYHNLAQIAAREGNYEEAIEHFHSTLRMREKLNDDYGIGLTQNNLGILHWNRGEVVRAEHDFAHSLKLMEKAGDVRTVASLNNNLGIIYREKNEWNKALEHYERSYQIYRRIGDTKSMVALYNNLAVVYRHWGRWRKAIEFYTKSLRFSEKMDMQSQQGITLQNLGSVFLDMGKLEEAHAALQKSLNLRNELGDKRSAAGVLAEIGRYWTERRIWDKALKTLRRSLDQVASGEDEQNIARIRALQALIHLRTGKLKLGQSILSKAEEYYQRSGDHSGLGRTNRLWGLFYSLKGEFDSAEDCFRRSLEIFRKIDKEHEFGVTLLELTYHSLRSWSAGRNPGEIQNALLNLREAEEIFDRLEMNGRLEETHKISIEMLDLVSGSFLPAYSRVNQLNTLYEVSKLINSILDLNSLFTTTMELVIQLLNAERGVLLLLNPETRRLEVAAGKEMDRETIRDVTKLSNSIIARVTKGGEPIICMDALSDSRFRNRKSVILHKIRSLLCVPLKTNESVLGTIYVDSRLSDNVFGEQDKDFLVVLANLVSVAIDRARLHQKLEKETVNLKREVVKRYSFQNLVGKNEKMREVYNLIEKVSRTDSTVLLTGESGTGKDLVARAIHLLSNRRDNSFVMVSCAAIPEGLLESELFGHAKGSFTGAIRDKQGLFEAASSGTIFLNEIGDAPSAVQAKLLRVLETGEIRRVGETECRRVGVRVICATNKDLKRRIEQNLFREDLYYRLNVVNIHLPPLRERRDDIRLIADHFRRLCCKMLNKKITGFSREVTDFLCRYDWPGNVRQLENCIGRACAIADSEELKIEDLQLEEEIPEEMGGFKEAMDLLATNRIKQALGKCGGNRTKAAELLGIRRQQIQRYIRKYKISEYSQNKRNSATN